MRKVLILTILCAFILYAKSQRVIPDTSHLYFRLGSNFDFLSENLSLTKVYGKLGYSNERICRARIGNRTSPINNHLYFGLDISGSKSNSLTVLNKNYISNISFVDPANPLIDPDTIRVVNRTIKSTQSRSFGQLSLYANPMISMNFENATDTSRPYYSVNVSLGAYFEMYQATSYIKYTDTTVLRDSISHQAAKNQFIGNKFYDSVGATNIYGYFGLSFLLSVYTPEAIIKLKVIFGNTAINNNVNYAFHPTIDYFGTKQNNFYIVESSITEPKSKLAIMANIRGLLPNYSPVWGVYVTKTFDIAKLYEAIVH